MVQSKSTLNATVPTALSLPPVVHVDTEVTTNVVISSWQRGAAKFAFSLSCLATPSNNVEAAFVSNENGECKMCLGALLIFHFPFFIFHLDETFTVGTPLDPTAIFFR